MTTSGPLMASQLLQGFLATTGNGLAAIFELSGSQWSPFRIQPAGGTAVGTDFPLTTGTGYLVYSAKAATYGETGTLPAGAPTWVLTTGWNLVGLPQGVGTPAAAAVLNGILASSQGSLAATFALSGGAWTPSLIQQSGHAPIGAPFTLAPGQAYLVFTDKAASYTPGSAAPPRQAPIRPRWMQGARASVPRLPPFPALTVASFHG